MMYPIWEDNGYTWNRKQKNFYEFFFVNLKD